MATKKYWVGTTGPFLYDDVGTYSDAVNYKGFRTTGIIRADGVPVNDNDVTRLVDLNASVDKAKINALIYSSFRG